MSIVAVAVAILLAVPPVVPQTPSPSVDGGIVQAESAEAVVVPESLRRAFALMKQPGFHPLLLELFEVEMSPDRALASPAPAALKTWQGVLIAVAIAVAVLVGLAIYGLSNS